MRAPLPAHTPCNFIADDLDSAETIIAHYPLFSRIDLSLLDAQSRKAICASSSAVEQIEEEKSKKLNKRFRHSFFLAFV